MWTPVIQPPFARALGNRALLFGDSITKNNSILTAGETGNGSAGFLTAFNQLSGQKINLAFNKGTTGDTTNQMLARYDADVAVNYSNFDILFMLGGTNDLIYGQAGTSVSYPRSITKETTLANLQAMALRALAAGKVVVLQTVYPRGGTGWNPITDGTGRANLAKEMCWINDSLRLWRRSLGLRAPLFLVDPFRSLADPANSSGACNFSLFPDGLHPNGAGAYLVGKQMVSDLSSLLAPLPGLVSCRGAAYDVTYNPLGHLNSTNPFFATTTGGTGTNVDGSVPASWTVSRTAGPPSSEVVVSTIVNSAAYQARPGNTLQLLVAMASGQDADELVYVQAPAIAASGNFAAGDTIFGSCEIDATGLTNYLGCRFLLNCYDGASTVVVGDGTANNGYGYTNDDHSIVMRTPNYVFPAFAGASPTITPAWQFFFKADTGTAGGTLKLSGPCVAKAA